MQESVASHRILLEAFPAFRSADLDEAREIVTNIYGDNKLTLGPGAKRLRAYANHCQLEEVGISYGLFGAPIEFAFPSFTGGYTIACTVAGGGQAKTRGQTFELSTQQTYAVSAGAPVNIFQSADYETITVQLSRAGMQRKLASLMGVTPNDDLVFEPLFDFRRPENATWRRLIWFLVEEIESRGGLPPKTAVAEIEQALFVIFLKANPSNYSHLLAAQVRGAAPWQVRRAEAYIEAHWDQPITIEALSLVTNSSARSIFYAFKQSWGYSPMAFVKQLRLKHARQMLTAPMPDTSVADVAFACGFSHLGHFAKDYSEQFGERPSQTLNSARGVVWIKPEFVRASRRR